MWVILWWILSLCKKIVILLELFHCVMENSCSCTIPKHLPDGTLWKTRMRQIMENINSWYAFLANITISLDSYNKPRHPSSKTDSDSLWILYIVYSISEIISDFTTLSLFLPICFTCMLLVVFTKYIGMPDVLYCSDCTNHVERFKKSSPPYYRVLTNPAGHTVCAFHWRPVSSAHHACGY